jgi:hypothetical protein
MRSFALALGMVLLGSPGCVLFEEDEPAQNDGDVCSRDDECSAGYCTSASICAHSMCDCPSGSCAAGGEETSACRDGWVCVGYESIFEPVVEFFHGEPDDSDGYCIPSCADGCPEHYTCNGELCSPDEYWAYPTPAIAWSGAASGELAGRGATTTVSVEEGSSLTLVGSATSPTATEITGLSWATNSQAGGHEMLEGAMLELTVPTGAGSYARAELTAIDAQGRAGIMSVVFQACFGAGTSCGYEGSGCCTSCDDATSTCR